MTKAIPFLQKAILLSYDPLPSGRGLSLCCGLDGVKVKQSLEGFINNYNEIMAGAVISIVPVAILFMIFQRFILTGLSKNAMK